MNKTSERTSTHNEDQENLLILLKEAQNRFGYLSPEVIGNFSILFVAHIGQLLQGLYLADVSGIAKKSGRIILVILIAWVLLNDYMDYVVGTHPIIPEEGIGTVAIVTVIISLISVGIVYGFSLKKKDLFKSIGILKRMRSDLL